MSIRRLVFIAVLAFASVALAQPLTVAPNDPHLQYSGRFTSDHTFGWTGSAIRCRFTNTAGTSLEAHFTTDRRRIAMQVVVDREPRGVIYLTRDQQRYDVVDDLPPGEHTVALVQRTEPYFGGATFVGFTLSGGATLRPLPSFDRRILALGDSITCGYGNDANDPAEGNTAENENGYMSYAAIAARHLDADLTMLCWSGKGMFRDRSERPRDRMNPLPTLLERTLPLRDANDWPMDRHVPDVITINLGTNDLFRRDGEKPALQKDDYVTAYRQCIERLHRDFPGARIFACIGPMAFDPIDAWVRALADDYEYVHYVEFAPYAGGEDVGGHWHPSVTKHRRMAKHLAAEIQRVMDW